jgi:hypothetical protein
MGPGIQTVDRTLPPDRKGIAAVENRIAVLFSSMNVSPMNQAREPLRKRTLPPGPAAEQLGDVVRNIQKQMSLVMCSDGHRHRPAGPGGPEAGLRRYGPKLKPRKLENPSSVWSSISAGWNVGFWHLRDMRIVAGHVGNSSGNRRDRRQQKGLKLTPSGSRSTWGAVPPSLFHSLSRWAVERPKSGSLLTF